MKYFILFVLVIWLLKRLGVFRFMFRSLVTKAVNEKFNQHTENTDYQQHREEGEVFISKKKSSKGHTGNTGDYVDFEEIK